VRHVRRHSLDEEARASFAELFFDLVFVLAVTQLSAVLVADLSWEGVGKTLFLLLVAWWAWIYTTWMTNWFDPEKLAVRAVLFVAMLASMIGAVALPDAFGERGLLLVLGYVGIQFVRNGFMVWATHSGDPLRAPVLRIFAWHSWVALIWIAGGIAEDGARVAIWLAALALDYLGPAVGHWTPGLGRSRPRDWELEPAHFTERICLFIIIALGESIVVAGATASDLEPTVERMLGVVVAFGMTAAMWWLYFDYHRYRALEVMKAAAGKRGRLGRDVAYVHVPIIAGIIVAAVASELVIAHPDESLHGTELATLAVGPILYLLGSVAFKLRVIREPSGKRLMAAAVVLAVTLLSQSLPSLATWSLVLAIFVALGAAERVERRSAQNTMTVKRTRAPALRQV
jgi:low temperature requirement protein LtrA